MITKIKMIVASALLSFMAPAMSFAQEAVQEAVDTTAVAVETAAAASEGFSWDTVWGILIAVAFLALSLAMIGHMIYVKFIKADLAENHTPDSFRRMRQVGEFLPEAEANAKAAEIFCQAYDAWTTITLEDGREIKIPYCRKDVVRSYAAAEEIMKLAPTDPELIDAFNEFSHDLNESMRRSFDGSKTFMIISLAIGLIFGFAANAWPFFGMIAVSSIIYWLSSQTTLWMDVRQELKGKGGRRSFMTRLIGGLFGAAATATTYKVITEYSDGSKTEETDNSNFWMSFIFAIVVMFFLAVFMFFVAAINYLRNYIFYR